MNESLDLVARRVVMSCLLYYGLDSPAVSDAQYDEWVQRLVKEWPKLEKLRQWQLGGRKAIAASGHAVKVTKAAVGGCKAWQKAIGHIMVRRPWQWDEEHRVHWLTPADFYLEQVRKRNRL